MRCGWYNIENEVHSCCTWWPSHYCTQTHSSDFIRCAKISNTYLFHNDGYNIEDLALKRIRRTQTELTPIHFLSSGSSNIYRRRTLGFNHSKWENADGDYRQHKCRRHECSWQQTSSNLVSNENRQTHIGIYIYIYIYTYITRRKVTSKFIFEWAQRYAGEWKQIFMHSRPLN
jgi:hypothetical protein